MSHQSSSSDFSEDESSKARKRKRYKRSFYAGYTEDEVSQKNYRKWLDTLKSTTDTLRTRRGSSASSSYDESIAEEHSCADDISNSDFIDVNNKDHDDIDNQINNDNDLSQDTNSYCGSGADSDYNSDSEKSYSDEQNDADDLIFDSVMFQESNITVRDLITMLSAFALRFHLSDEGLLAIADMFKLVAGPKFVELNLSKYQMERCVPNQDEYMTFHYYCSKCLDKILYSRKGNQKLQTRNFTCEKCESNIIVNSFSPNYFISINLAHQIEQILSNDNLLKDILKNLSIRNEYQNNNTITDFSNGQIQRTILQEANEKSSHLITLNFSTDGAPLTNSGKRAFWPLQLIVNSLSPKYRFKNILLAGILLPLSEPKPDLMNLYMTIFIDQIRKLGEDGISIIKNGNEFTFTFCCNSCIVDSVCRPVMQNRLQFNGYQACSWCYKKGVNVEGFGVRYTVDESCGEELRSKESHASDVKLALLSQKFVRGVKGDSALKRIPFFDMTWSFCYEYMHGMLLGVCFQIWNEWKSGNSQFKLNKKNIDEVEKKFLILTPSKEIHRLPRTGIIAGSKRPKASELKSWLLYYSLPCLKNILNEEALNHYTLLVKSAYTLMKPQITEQELKTCERDLTEFVVFYEYHYDKASMTFNIHTLLHVCQSIRQTGLLISNSAFPFESNIYTLKSFVKGPNGMDRQIARKSLQSLKFKSGNVGNVSKEAQVYVMNLFIPHRLTISYDIGLEENVIYVGRGRRVNDIPNIEYCLSYRKIIFNGTVYHSSKYRRPKKTDDTIVQLNDTSFAKISQILKIVDDCYLQISLFTVKPKNPFHNVIHIKEIDTTKNERLCLVPLRFIKTKAMLINVNENSYICTLPNVIEIQ